MIRIVDRTTGKTIQAKGGKDAATIVGNVLERQWYKQNIDQRKDHATQTKA
jgi:hypothetical protein